MDCSHTIIRVEAGKGRDFAVEDHGIVIHAVVEGHFVCWNEELEGVYDSVDGVEIKESPLVELSLVQYCLLFFF